MIPGLEYERSSSYEQQPDTYQTQNTQLHRRRPQTNGANGHSGHNGLSSGDDDKYSKRTRAVRKLDFFNKIEVDHIVRTERGGQLTAVGYVIMLVLILAEYFTWRGMNGESIEHVVVDTSLGKRMKVNLNITFPSLHCEDLHLNIIDVAGDSQLEVSDKMFKQRLDLDGNPRPLAKISAEANAKALEDKKKKEILDKSVGPDYCGPCYGAQENEEDCCNTCDDVIERYRKKRWNENAVQPLAEQCIREGKSGVAEPKKMAGGEGCNLSGHFTVNRVAGNFHIAMGEGVERDGRHIHQFLPEDRVNFIANHVIHELSFLDDEYGDIEGEGFLKMMSKSGVNGERSMNGVVKTVTEDTGTTGLFQYFIKVVPTKYKGDIIDDMGVSTQDGQEKKLETNRYFYTERFRPLIGEIDEDALLAGDAEKGTAGAHVSKAGGTQHQQAEHHAATNAVLPGVFFVYEIYPFMVEVTRNRVPFMHLWIRIMATVGGVFTIMSWIDGAFYSRDKRGGRR